MLHLIRKIISIVSLLLALITAILWLRSWSKPFHFSKEIEKSLDTNQNVHRELQFHSLDTGYVSISYVSAIVDYSKEIAAEDRIHKKYPDILSHWLVASPWSWFRDRGDPPKETTAGFSLNYGFYKSSESQLESINGNWIRATLPHWFLILLLSIPGFIHTARQLKRRLRLRRGLCPTCGYDLRESKSTCPECGAAVPSW